MKHVPSRLAGSLAAALLAAGLFTACGGGDEQSAEFAPGDQLAPSASAGPSGDPVPEQGGSAAEDESNGSAGDAQEGTGGGGSGTPVHTDQPGPEDALETIAYDLSDGTTVTLGLHSLRVEGELMILELSFTPEIGATGTADLFTLNRGSRIGPLINDRVNLRQYQVLTDSDGVWATGSGPGGPRAAGGQTLTWTGHYAAPIDDIDTLTIAVTAGVVEFTDVRIER